MNWMEKGVTPFSQKFRFHVMFYLYIWNETNIIMIIKGKTKSQINNYNQLWINIISATKLLHNIS